MDLGIRDKYALVTGGSHGIGLSIALALAREHCHVAICARNRERLDGAIREIDALGNFPGIAVEADVTQPEAIAGVMAAIESSWGRLHILVNNVGGGGRWGNEKVEANDDTVWREVFDTNTMAAIRFIREAIPYMRKEQWGRVITITSIFGREGGGRPWFNLAKAAQTSLMKTMAMNRDLARDGLTFNSIAPGPIMIPDTGWDRERLADPEGFEDQVNREIVRGRLGTPEEVADVVAFLCSERAAYVNGASVVVDGGQSHAF